MLKNYLKMIFRNLVNQKAFSIINIIGLALGMFICILSLIFIRYELSFDTYHKKVDNIYRVTQQHNTPSGYTPHFARCHETWINNLPNEFPEIETLIRFQWTPSVNLKIGENKLRSFKWYYTDANVFDVFSFSMIEGNPATALTEPRSVVLTKEMSQKYFGTTNPIGKEIIVVDEGSGQYIPHKITGVINNLPANSHFHVEFLVSYPSAEARQGWAWIYLLLKPGTNAALLEKKFPDFIKKYDEEEAAQTSFLHLQPLKDIHLYSNLDREIEPNGDIQYVYIFSAVALLVILIAVFNFMNLSTARSIKRAKEVGVRKVLGADRKQLANYFLWESVLFSLFAFFIAVLLVITTFPYYNALLGNSISLGSVFSLPMVLGFLLLAFVTGICSGIYPSIILSSFGPLTALSKGNQLTKSGKQLNLAMRRILVVLQFTISIVLIIFTLFCFNQFSFINNKKLGINKEQILAITKVSDNDRLKFPVFKNALEKYAGITGVTACMDVPSSDILDAGFTQVEGIHKGNESTLLSLESVENDFVDVMGINIITGNKFNRTLGNSMPPKLMDFSEMQNYVGAKEFSFILNESAVKKIGWSSPGDALGKKLQWSNAAFNLSGRIVGVVKDYHYASLHLQIRPLILVNEPSWQGNFLVKVSPNNLKSTINYIDKEWNKVYPNSPLQYEFLDDMFAELYKSEERQGQLLSIFSVLAIFIAYLGLYSLVAYSTEQRTKEIGIRKVMGASITGVVFLLVKEYAKWILLANLLAIPIGYYFVTKWLENFAYRINVNINLFLLAGGLSLIIAFITVYYQTVKAAAANPIDSLRYE